MPQAPGFLQFSPCPGCRMQSLAWVLPSPVWVRQLEFTQEAFVCCPDGLTCLGTSPSFPLKTSPSLEVSCSESVGAKPQRAAQPFQLGGHVSYGKYRIRLMLCSCFHVYDCSIIHIAIRQARGMLHCILITRSLLKVILYHFQLPEFDAHNKTSFILTPTAVNFWTTAMLS